MTDTVISGRTYIYYFLLLGMMLLFTASFYFAGFSFYRYNRYRSKRIRCVDYVNKRFDMHTDFYSPENVEQTEILPRFTFTGDECTSKKIPDKPYNPVIDKLYNFKKQKDACGLGLEGPDGDNPWVPTAVPYKGISSNYNNKSIATAGYCKTSVDCKYSTTGAKCPQ